MAARILYASHEVECGGAELSLLDLIGGLDRARYTPLLAVSGPGPLADRARAAGAEVFFVPMRGRGAWRKLARLPGAVRALGRLARGRSAALIHANTLVAGYPSVWAARKAGVPSVWHVRDLGYPALARAACARATRIVANSAATAAGLPADRTVVVHNGVGPEFFASGRGGEGLRRDLGVDDADLLAGTLGRLDPWKGHEDLLEAVAALARRQPRLRLWIAGGELFGRSGYRARLEARIARPDLAGRVRLLGPRNDVPRVLDALDVLVHPSREPEPFGRAVAEAQAGGRAVIATDAGGIPEIVEHERTGLLVPAGDPAALAAALDRLARDRDGLRRMGEAGRARARERFTTARHAAAIQSLYDGLLRSAASSERAVR